MLVILVILELRVIIIFILIATQSPKAALKIPDVEARHEARECERLAFNQRHEVKPLDNHTQYRLHERPAHSPCCATSMQPHICEATPGSVLIVAVSEGLLHDCDHKSWRLLVALF